MDSRIPVIIKVLIFSKDRAMQLEAVLRSFFLHCHDYQLGKITVLFTTSSVQHADQYAELQREYQKYPNLVFVRQGNFRQDVINDLIKGSGLTERLYRRAAKWNHWIGMLLGMLIPPEPPAGELLFLVDDNLFVRDFLLTDCIDLLEHHPDILGVSLRLGRNTGFCYPFSRVQSLPVFDHAENGILVYRWVGADLDFSYPLEVSSSIYRLTELARLLIGLPFQNPNELEEQMAIHAKHYKKKLPILACFEKSITFCNPINKVQTAIPNLAGQVIRFSPQDLAVLFDEGKRIDVLAYKDFTPNGCHQEVDLVFKERGAMDA